MYSLKNTFILVLSFILPSCHPKEQMVDRFVSREVMQHELVGNWKLSVETIERIKDFSSTFLDKQQYIKLNADGSCTVEVYPYTTSVSLKELYVDKTYECRWELTRSKNYINHKAAEMRAVKILPTKKCTKMKCLILIQ